MCCLSHRVQGLVGEAYWKVVACLRLKIKGVSLVALVDFALEIRYALLGRLSGDCIYRTPYR
jgi:hypothetical protein